MLAIERLADDLMRTGEQLLRFPDFFGDSSSVYPEDRPSRRALKRRREGDIDLFTTSSLWQKWRPVTDIAEVSGERNTSVLLAPHFFFFCRPTTRR
jgi:hypothetical protein